MYQCITLKPIILIDVHADRHYRDSPFTEEEVLENNSPDTDGLGAELYKSFSSQLAPFLFQVFNESVERGCLPPSLTQGLIDFFSLKRTYILLIIGD